MRLSGKLSNWKLGVSIDPKLIRNDGQKLFFKSSNFMKNMCFFAFLRPFLESTRSFGQLSSSFFQISGSNLLFPHSNGKSRIDGLMTKRPIDGPFRRIIFHPFPAFGCKSIVWRAIEGAIWIADGFQSYQSSGTIGPKKTKKFDLSYFHRRSDSAVGLQSCPSPIKIGHRLAEIIILS